MIRFLTEEIRVQFHLLPLERQRQIHLQADSLLEQGKSLTVLFACAETSELSVRIDEEFNGVRSFDSDNSRGE